MHPKEFKKEKNGTGHMTNLQLENAEIIVGVDFTNCNRVNALLNKENSTSFLLYPGMNNFNLSTRKTTEVKSFIGQQANIFILDGTWPCARKMLKLSKNLQDLPRISFDNTIQSKFIIKQQPDSLCLSTIESVKKVIDLLNDAGVEQCDTKDFLLPFEKMIEHQVECILNPHNKNHYRPKADTVLTPKTLYKKDSERNIIFEKDR
jgi:DTW domain-containing protein YfiP